MDTNMHPHAQIAIRAAKNYRSWGRYAAVTYCRKRGVPIALLTLARVLETARRAGVA